MITASDVITILQEAIYTTIIAAAPMLIVAIVVGLIVSVFQATTQINEQTLAFVPKIIAILLSILLCGGFIIEVVTSFTTELYLSIGTFLS